MRFPHLLAALIAVALPLTALAQGREYKTLRIGMDASYAPFESVNSKGEIIGFEVDYANALCAKMKVTCTFQNQDWDGIIPSLLGGKFDVIMSSMNVTEARAKRVLFSDTYYAVPPVWSANSSVKTDDVSPAALKGKSIGTQSSTVHANFLEKLYGASTIKLYPTQDEANLDLANGRIDYVVGDELVTAEFIEKKGAGCCRLLSRITRLPDVHGPGVGAAFRPDDTGLRDLFNKAIAEADADGTYDAIQKRYFQQSIRGK